MHFKMSSAICFSLDRSKILSSGNGLSIRIPRRKVYNDEQEKVDAKHQSRRKKNCLMLQESQGKSEVNVSFHQQIFFNTL